MKSPKKKVLNNLATRLTRTATIYSGKKSFMPRYGTKIFKELFLTQNQSLSISHKRGPEGGARNRWA